MARVQSGADIFDSITEKKLVMSRCLLSKRTEKDDAFFTGNTHHEGKFLLETISKTGSSRNLTIFR